MSWWTDTRDAVTGTVAPIANVATGGLLGTLGGASGLGGIGSLFGGGLMGLLGGGSGSMGNAGYGSLGGTMSTFPSSGSDQYGSLMDMLGRTYGQQPQVSPTGTTNLSNQGLI